MKILIYQIGQLGDTIVSIPALRAVRQHFGLNFRISLLHDVTHRLVTSEMVLQGTGLIDEFIPYTPAKSFGSKVQTMIELWRTLRRERFEACLPRSRSGPRGPSSTRRGPAVGPLPGTGRTA